jgi:DNA repair protein RadC
MAISDWPLHERPREKLLHQGVATLSDAELLAIFLQTGIRGKTALDVARDLLLKFGGLRALLECNFEKFCEMPGLGLAKYAKVQAALEISRRYLQDALKREDVLQNTLATRHYVKAKLRSHAREVFACLFLDAQLRMICFEELFQGSISQAIVHSREVVKRALAHNAAAIILAHNHPSGVATPSQADLEITTQLAQALKLVEVQVLDHIIVGDQQVISMKDLGLL